VDLREIIRKLKKGETNRKFFWIHKL